MSGKETSSVVKYPYDFVPFYRGKFRKAGVIPDGTKSLRDLAKLPVIRKDEPSE